MKYVFDWYFDQEDFNKANESRVEDDIFGAVFVSTKENKYYIDIHKEYYSSIDNGYDLEIYEDLEEGGHGYWYGSIHEIRSAVSLERFKKRAEKLIGDFVEAIEWNEEHRQRR